MKSITKHFRRDERGATAIEYGLIAALVAVIIIAGVAAVGGSLNELFTGISETISDPASAVEGSGT